MFRRSAALCFRHSVVLGVKHPAHGRPAELEIAAAIDAVAERNGKAPLELDTEQDVQELESGPGNSVLGVLEQRGLVKEIAGYVVFKTPCWRHGTDLKAVDEMRWTDCSLTSASPFTLASIPQHHQCISDTSCH